MTDAVDVDTGPIAWREAGSGDPVLFLHGLGGSRTAWEPQLADLSDRWRCIAWDLPGYGASAPLPEHTFPAVADAVARLLDTLGADRVPLVGLSLGGMHALHTALRHPDRVLALALLATSPAFALDGTTDAAEWMALRLDPLDRGVTPAEMAPGVLRAVAGSEASDTVIAQAAAAMSRIPPDGLRAAVRCLPTHDVRARLRDIRQPTLVVVGELDSETPISYARHLTDHIPSARLAVVPGAGHLVNLEAPGPVNGLLRSFLAEYGSPTDDPPSQEGPTS